MDSFIVEETLEAEQRDNVIEAANQLTESEEPQMEEDQSEGEGAQESEPVGMDLELPGNKGKEPGSVKRKKKRSAKPKKKRVEEEGEKFRETEGGALRKEVAKTGELPVDRRDVEEGGREDSVGFLSPTVTEHLARATGVRKVGGDTSELSSGTDET
ncbi:hypothetical protein Y1Q_0001547 [Alligator mississippiensis]|uniref:Uncharacterized protein n=1 Tax=Alligator mississippiensis TaxID=8496 RepID=A0A151M9X6_ALLMI|nr:hypothetical protein Y1Q_0001547 [Alligator mississippiensis]